MTRWPGLLGLLLVGCSSSQTPSEPDLGGSGSESRGGSDGTGGAVAMGGSAGSGGGAQGGSSGGGGTSNGSGGSGGGMPGTACLTGPALTPGVWKEITPASLNVVSDFGANDIEVDPHDTCVLYACFDMEGICNSTDGGSTWTRLGTAPASPNYGNTASYIDSPIRVAIDPADSKHLYATQGVRGNTQGFWVSTDGGLAWAKPAGFVAISASTTTSDVTTLAVDPTDFKHVLLGSHSAWKSLPNAGIMETTDGGTTWTLHAPVAGWASGSMGVNFLYDAASGTDLKTWLVSNDNGFWRTTDAGTTWAQVSTNGGTHGGADVFRSTTGALYTGAFVYPMRSTDNGVTWAQIKTGLSYAAYYIVIGDGKSLYTNASFATKGAFQNLAYATSSESDGVMWTPYEGGAQKVGNGPYRMRFDKANGIVYSANWDSGIWALKVK